METKLWSGFGKMFCVRFNTSWRELLPKHFFLVSAMFLPVSSATCEKQHSYSQSKPQSNSQKLREVRFPCVCACVAQKFPHRNRSGLTLFEMQSDFLQEKSKSHHTETKSTEWHKEKRWSNLLCYVLSAFDNEHTSTHESHSWGVCLQQNVHNVHLVKLMALVPKVSSWVCQTKTNQ